MHIIHVVPTPFGRDGMWGGGERYPLELARALSRHTDVELLTFGRRPGLRLDPSGLLPRLRHNRAVTFAGAVPETQLSELYRRAAVFVLPTVRRDCYGREFRIAELLGLSVLEAMASGTPVVASRLDALPEVVRDGETGFLVTPGDVEELHDR